MNYLVLFVAILCMVVLAITIGRDEGKSFRRWLKNLREKRKARRKERGQILRQRQLNEQILKEERAEALHQRIQDIRDDQ